MMLKYYFVFKLLIGNIDDVDKLFKSVLNEPVERVEVDVSESILLIDKVEFVDKLFKFELVANCVKSGLFVIAL